MSVSTPPEGGTWREYFNRLRGEEIEVPPSAITSVVWREMDPDLTGVGKSILGVYSLSEFFTINRIYLTRTHTSAEFYAADSTDLIPGTDTPKHRRGDLKKDEFERTNWFVDGFSTKANFRAHWTEGVTAKGARSFKFESAIVHDDFGFIAVPDVDYSPGKADLAIRKDEPGWAHKRRSEEAVADGERMAALYNVGDCTYYDRLFKSSTEFTDWLAFAVDRG